MPIIIEFDYQLNRHCSKTQGYVLIRQVRFDYQLNRHCSKTARFHCRHLPSFDYQLNRHCSKTDGTAAGSFTVSLITS